MTDFRKFPDLATRALGGAVVAANDEFFAAKENLVAAAEPTPRAEFGHKGKEYDGWETRRRRSPGHPRAAVHPPRRRRRAAAGARHRGPRPAAAGRRSGRPGGAGERRPGHRGERRVLRPPCAASLARTGPFDGRGLGDPPSPR